MRLSIGNMIRNLNTFNLWCQPTNPYDEPLDVNSIQELSNEHLEEEFFDELDNLLNESLFSDILNESYN